jgi:hypothetical protein
VGSSWNHEVFRLDDPVVDHHDRFGVNCATGKCTNLPVYETTWDYVTGRVGRISPATRQVCADHGEKFAAKHGLTIGDPRTPRTSPVTAAIAAMTGGTIHTVRVFHSRGGQWYMEEGQLGAGMLSGSNRWLSGVRGDATLDQAVVEAETLLAQRRGLVPAGPWQRTEHEATVHVIPAQRSDTWLDKPWELRIACDDEGMWKLTRTLDPSIEVIKNDLGNNNMSLDRALRVAGDILAEAGWVLFSDTWSTYDDDTAENGGWHPDQVNPGAWREEEQVA